MTLVALGLLTPGLSEGRPPDAPIFPYPIASTELDNGLTVLSVPFDSPGIIAYYTVVRTGSRNEVETGLSGFAHFFEHMMFRGTEAVLRRTRTTTTSRRSAPTPTPSRPTTGPATT